ncbi:MAG: type II toxin-antitoxin system RelE family toxin [Actinomycetes bacterium]
MSEYRVDWSGPARRALQRMPEKVATAVIEFVYASLARNPQRVGKALTLGMAGLYSARRGDYRVIYAINEQQRAVEVVAVEHRADVYRRR